eukprot:g39508.t1
MLAEKSPKPSATPSAVPSRRLPLKPESNFASAPSSPLTRARATQQNAAASRSLRVDSAELSRSPRGDFVRVDAADSLRSSMSPQVDAAESLRSSMSPRVDYVSVDPSTHLAVSLHKSPTIPSPRSMRVTEDNLDVVMPSIDEHDASRFSSVPASPIRNMGLKNELSGGLSIEEQDHVISTSEGTTSRGIIPPRLPVHRRGFSLEVSDSRESFPDLPSDGGGPVQARLHHNPEVQPRLHHEPEVHARLHHNPEVQPRLHHDPEALVKVYRALQQERAQDQEEQRRKERRQRQADWLPFLFVLCLLLLLATLILLCVNSYVLFHLERDLRKSGAVQPGTSALHT